MINAPGNRPAGVGGGRQPGASRYLLRGQVAGMDMSYDGPPPSCSKATRLRAASFP